MDAGKTAAGFIGECLDQGNFDAEVLSIWHDIWMDRFGSDFKWSVHDNHGTFVVLLATNAATITTTNYFSTPGFYIHQKELLERDVLLVRCLSCCPTNSTNTLKVCDEKKDKKPSYC